MDKMSEIMDFQYKDAYNITDLIGIMRILRSPNGCPWDKVQTHESIRQNFIEETYEAVEAIDKGDSPLLKEELGDVLMQGKRRKDALILTTYVTTSVRS